MSDKWTEADIPDQSGRTAVVTGANSGLGLITARELARHGANVILACRNTAKGDEAAAAILQDAPSGKVDVQALDLAELASVHAFAEAQDGPIDLLVNNAGVMAIPRRETKDGFEMQFGVNHLGHFALTGLLMSQLLEAADPRVVTLSSTAHKFGRMSFGDLQGERRYFRWAAYGQSKLSNLLFAFELQRRADEAGLALTSVAAHPGYAATNLQTRAPEAGGLLTRMEDVAMGVANRVVAQSDEMGTLPTLYAATFPDLPGGSYLGPDGFQEQRGHPRLVGTTSAARDTDAARRLWQVSEELTGVTYDLAPAAA